MNNSEEEVVKMIKIVRDSSPVSEKVMCYICRASLMSQYLVRHMKSGHSDDCKNSENNDRDASRVLLKIRRMCLLKMQFLAIFEVFSWLSGSPKFGCAFIQGSIYTYILKFWRFNQKNPSRFLLDPSRTDMFLR